MVSQQHKRIKTRQKDETGDISERDVKTDQERCENEATASHYSSLKSTAQVTAIRKGAMAVKTQEQNSWADLIWCDWIRYRRSLPPADKEEENKLKEDFTEMTVTAMNFWLCKFVVEIRRKDKILYVPDTVRGKILEGENFGEFGEWLAIRQNFSHQYL